MDRIIVNIQDGEVTVFSDLCLEVVVVNWGVSPDESNPEVQAITLKQEPYEAAVVRVVQSHGCPEHEMGSDVRLAIAAFLEPPTSGPGGVNHV